MTTTTSSIATSKEGVDRTVPSPRPLSISTSTYTSTPSTGRTRRLSLNIPNPPTRTPPVPVPARQGSIHRQRTSFSINTASPHDRRTGSSLSLSLSLSHSAGRSGWPGKESRERFVDDEWLKIKLGDVGRDEVGSVVCGEEGMERAVEVCSRPTIHLSPLTDM
jgi:hypothetical protein